MSHKPAHHQLTTHALDALHWIARKLGVPAEGFADVNKSLGIPTGNSIFRNPDGAAFSIIHSEELRLNQIDLHQAMYQRQIAAHDIRKHVVLILCRHQGIPTHFREHCPWETHFLLIQGDRVVEIK